MENLSPEQRSEKLSSYIDGALTEDERRDLEAYLLTHPDAQSELQELTRLKELMTSQKRLPADGAFWTRLSVEIDKHKQEEQNLLPFPRKFMPIVAATGVVGVLVAGFLTFQNRLPLLKFVTEKSEAVKQVYNEGVLQGSLLPVFSNIDRNSVLQFALFGMLPLDANAHTALRVDENSDKGYRIEVGRPAQEKGKPVTVDEFLSEISPTRDQKETIDSLLKFAQNRIETSVFMGDNDAVAINADLAQLNKLMISSIASCLEPKQRARMVRILESRDAPYTLSSRNMRPARREKIFENISRAPRQDRFVVITPETLMYSHLALNAEKMVRESEKMAWDLQARQERMIRKFMKREFALPQTASTEEPPAPGQKGPDFFRVEIENRWMPLSPDPLHVVVLPRVRRERPFPQNHPEDGLEFRIFSDSSNPEDLPSIRFYRLGRGTELEGSISGWSRAHPEMRTGILEQRSLDSMRHQIEQGVQIQRHRVAPKPVKPESMNLPRKKRETPLEV